MSRRLHYRDWGISFTVQPTGYAEGAVHYCLLVVASGPMQARRKLRQSLESVTYQNFSNISSLGEYRSSSYEFINDKGVLFSSIEDLIEHTHLFATNDVKLISQQNLFLYKNKSL